MKQQLCEADTAIKLLFQGNIHIYTSFLFTKVEQSKNVA